jgi:hypothetical protein
LHEHHANEGLWKVNIIGELQGSGDGTAKIQTPDDKFLACAVRDYI